MCGISGIVSDRAEVGSLDRVVAMALEQRHRGPDDSGAFLDTARSPYAGLSHRRLSIIDLSAAGRQPMTNEDGSLWLSYNGEIYNHALIRRELESKGHRYRSHTDSESILHAYEEWGDACVQRFRGMFAFAIWDTPRRRLLLARDRFGVKPLYYAVHNGSLAFASEIKAVLKSAVVPTEARESAIPEYLLFGYLGSEDTMFRHVHKLMPGHVLVYEDGRINVEQYWDLDFTPQAVVDETEAEQHVFDLLERSIEMRLMSDVPLGVFLSGGLDSSAIAAIMARHVTGRLKTFAVGFESQYYSEHSYARQVAEHIGAEHHEVVLTADNFLRTLPRLIWHEDEPIWGPPCVALHHVAALAADHVKVVLTGEGSDELFAGYDRYWMTHWNAMLGRTYDRVPAAIKSLAKRLLVNGPLPAGLRRGFGHTFLNHGVSPDQFVFDNWLGMITPPVQRAICTSSLLADTEDVDPYAAHRHFFESAKSNTVVDRLLYADVKTNLVELLMKQDKMTMAVSIESRVPFLDHEFAEFAAGLPWRMKVRGRSVKAVLKNALRAHLPATIVDRPKKGFPVPFPSWLRERFRRPVESVLLSEDSVTQQWVRPDAVRQLLASHFAGEVEATRPVWNLLSLELWGRIFLKGERSWADWPEVDWPSTQVPDAAHAQAVSDL